MIPTLEDILDDLVKGAITKQQALAWIGSHIDLAYEEGQDSMITEGALNGPESK